MKIHGNTLGKYHLWKEERGLNIAKCLVSVILQTNPENQFPPKPTIGDINLIIFIYLFALHSYNKVGSCI